MGSDLHRVESDRLLAKIQPPFLDERDHLRRPRLDARLRHQLVRHRVLVLQARAGQGKTRAAAELAAELRWPAVWYHLDESDNDWAWLLRGLAAAVGRTLGVHCAAPGTGDALPRNGTAPDPNTALQALLAHPAWSRHEAVLFILEDLHCLTCHSVAARLVATLLARAPSNVRLVITTRLPLDRSLTATISPRDHITLTDEALAFSREEAHAFLLYVLGMVVSSSQEEWLYREVGGWPLGLTLSRSFFHPQLGRRR